MTNARKTTVPTLRADPILDQQMSAIHADLDAIAVGSKELKAGEYLVQQFGSPESQSLQFRSENGDVQQTVFTVPIETNKTGNHERLVFHRYGEQYFLSQIWLSGDEDGHEFIAGAQEKKAAQNQSTGDQTVAGQ